MKRLIVLAIVTMMALAGCEGFKDGTPPTQPPIPPPVVEFPTTEVPVGGVPVRVEIRITDEFGVESRLEFDADIRMEIHYPPREGRPIPNHGTIFDTAGVPHESPWEFNALLPFDITQNFLDGPPILVIVEARNVTLGPWWQLACAITINGVVIVSPDNYPPAFAENNSALPMERSVSCVY